jgi:hypothetical protein
MSPNDPTRTVPFSSAVVGLPNDAGILNATKALYIGGAGNLRVTMADGQDVIFVGIPAGTILPLNVSRIWATNTTATNILRLS